VVTTKCQFPSVIEEVEDTRAKCPALVPVFFHEVNLTSPVPPISKYQPPYAEEFNPIASAIQLFTVVVFTHAQTEKLPVCLKYALFAEAE
jgi:hypothetical protein